MPSKGEGSGDQGNEGTNDRACGHSSTQWITQKRNGKAAQAKRTDSSNGHYTSGMISPSIVHDFNQCWRAMPINMYSFKQKKIIACPRIQ